MGQELAGSTLKKRSLPLPLRIASPYPSEGRGVQIKRGMRIDRESIDDYFIDYNLILRRSLPLPLRREGSADKRGMRIDRESIDDYFIDYNLIVNRL